MLSIPGYRITEILHTGGKTLVYRGLRLQDQCPVILKTLSDDYPASKDLACLQHEYTLTKDWTDNDLPRAYELIKHRNTLVLVQHDIGGVSVSRLLADKPFSLETFLTLALALARNLNHIHQQHLIHKDINPSNLVVNVKTGQVQIIDFGIATQLSRETPQVQNPGHLEGTLAYLSPEQTGRMNRALDYRTDFYSLGATYYEMLAGVPAFSATDPMELVHCHLARTPLPLHERNTDIPPVLSDLVQKLMAKAAEARYQSAFGLIADLQTCQDRLLASEVTEVTEATEATPRSTAPRIAAFPLGMHDVSERFRIPQKLYGRETQVQKVLDAFERVSQGQAEMLLVAGYSGVGKTALVHEVHKPITEKNGYYIEGKFDQFQRDIPYTSLIQAFRELVRQLLTESTAQISYWKTQLENALHGIAQVIIDVIPEVEWIMGPQPAVPELPPAQAQNRLNLVFQHFIHTFATDEHPLILFLDDLQWADLPSLQLIKLFMTTPESRHFLIIGAYRDNEVHAAHPFMLALEEIQKTATRLETITLKPLNLGHIRQLLTETLHNDGTQNHSLAELCLSKTQGNPFFLSQFLRALVDAGQIKFNHAIGNWEWDIVQLQQTQITSNVVDLMAEKIQTLPQATQAVIRLAACIGSQFDLITLAWVCEQSIPKVAQALWPALKKSLLIPLDDTYKHMAFENQASEPNSKVTTKCASFKFVHDRVQQAAYSLIGNDSKAVFHLRIGRRLLAHSESAEREERIFDLVYHMNRGQTLLTVQAEKEELAQLNLITGRKAKASAAYAPALSYFQTGLNLMGEAAWEGQYELTLALYVEATEAAYLSGNFTQMDQLAKIVLGKARTLLDQVKVYQIQIEANIFQNQALEAIKIALPVLKQLGVKLPTKPNALHVLRGLIETKFILAGKSIENLTKLPPMTEEVPKAAMLLISSIGSATYVAAPDLFPLISLKQVNLSVKYGNSGLSAHAYAAYGLILSGALGDIEAGYRFGQLAVTTLGNFPASAENTKVGFIMEALLKHWKDPLQDRLPCLLEVYQAGIQTGNFEYAAYAAFNYCYILYCTGRELGEIAKEVEKYAQGMVLFKQAQTAHWHNFLAQAILNLIGESEDCSSLTGVEAGAGTMYDEANGFKAKNRTAIFMLNFFSMIHSYLFGQYPKALKQAITAEQHLDGVIAHFAVPVCHFYMALIRLAAFAETPKNEQRRLLKKVASIQKKLKKWATHAPMNHLHKWHLVEAELARMAGEDQAAQSHYDQAITLAEENHFHQEAAVANELAAKFHLSKGRRKLAKIYLQDAHYKYRQWGAAVKVRHLEAHYPEWFSKAEKRTTQEDATTTMRNYTIADKHSGALDLATVMKASQSISGEIILERLLEKLMRIAIENAGAQKGVLLLKKDDLWRIEAQGDVGEAAVKVLQSLPITTAAPLKGEAIPAPILPISLIQYVELTKEALVLDNASGRGRFMNDAYIRQNKAKSILCAPILLQGKLAGMLYLENNLTEGVFTADRLEVLKILSAQAAISIQNASVYDTLEATVAQRTVALSKSNAALSIAYTAAETARDHAESAKHQATEALDNLREAQTQLVQSAKMASLGHLVAGVAHELNTPIGNALTTASVLADCSNALKTMLFKEEMRKTTLIEFVDDAVQMAGIISNSCQRAATLITSFKQVAADQTSEQRRTFDLHSLVEDNIAALNAGFKEAPWVIETEIADDIICDSYPGPLGQIITNLVQNAALHAFEGRDSGTLKIIAAVKPEAKAVELLFLDDGNGMDAVILAHIFEPFYTSRPEQRKGPSGPGLGLSISLNIATGVLGGTLHASSEVGCGSQFCLAFPLKAPSRDGADTGFPP